MAKERVSGSIGVRPIYHQWKKIHPEMSETDFSSIIKSVNEAFVEDFLNGNDINFPVRMGQINLRKFTTRVTLKDGKVKTNKPIDWKATKELWAEDEECRKNKTLVRRDVPFVYRFEYDTYGACYQNKVFFRFDVSRSVKIRVKEAIENNKLDAFLFKNS